MAGKEVPADGVVTGAASIDGRLIHLASQDFTVLGGSAGEVHSLKVADAMHRSLKTGSPFVFINDSGGARVQEGIDSLSGYGQVFYANVLLSGAVPQISLICGPCAGGASYSPALTDFIIQTRKAQMFITGPQVIKQVTGEEITADALGGADAHMAHSGVIHFVAEDDEEAIYICRRLLSFLPSNNLEEPPRLPSDDNVDPNPAAERHRADRSQAGLRRPRRDSRASSIRAICWRCRPATPRIWWSASPASWAARIGIIANQPAVLSGAIDINAANKAARFIRFCNAFNIPIVTFVDVPGLPAGRRAGIWRDHPQRRQDAVCLLGGLGAEDPGHPAQVVRRCARGDVLQGPRCRLLVCLADGRSGRDGRRRGRRDRVPQRDAGGRRQGGPRAELIEQYRAGLCLALRRGRSTLGRRHHRAGQHAAALWPRRWSTCRTSEIIGRPRSTA